MMHRFPVGVDWLSAPRLRLAVQSPGPAPVPGSFAPLPARALAGATGWTSKRCSPDSTRARVSRSSVSRDMRMAFLRMTSRKSREWLFSGAVQQGFGITLNGSQRRAQLVRYVGDEIAAGLLDAFGFGLVAQHRHRAASGQGSRSHIEGAARKNRSRPRGQYSCSCAGSADGAQKIRIANRLHHRRIPPGSLRNQPVHASDWPTAPARPGPPREPHPACCSAEFPAARWLVAQRGEVFLPVDARSCRARPPLAQFRRRSLPRCAPSGRRRRSGRKIARCAAAAAPWIAPRFPHRIAIGTTDERTTPAVPRQRLSRHDAPPRSGGGKRKET